MRQFRITVDMAILTEKIQSSQTKLPVSRQAPRGIRDGTNGFERYTAKAAGKNGTEWCCKNTAANSAGTRTKNDGAGEKTAQRCCRKRLELIPEQS
jgi:hypothetical protein